MYFQRDSAPREKEKRFAQPVLQPCLLDRKAKAGHLAKIATWK
jgi:hypothetical protein